MKALPRLLGSALLLMLGTSAVSADAFDDTIGLFKNAGVSAVFFGNCYGYAVFPTIGAGGLVIGGARGKGQVYAAGHVVGDAVMTQLSVGFQAGGKTFSEIIFFQDQRAVDAFTSGNFQFDASAGVVAITAGASATTGTAGSTSGASGGQKDAITSGSYNKGMAVFTIAKGGLMFDASLAGQKFSYKAREGHENVG